MQIRKLDPIVASRIAAGEVVERPSSVLRELLDNSIDAGASRISVYIEQGGIKSLTVTDDGCGMDKEDLNLACESHATSKVRTLEDLFNLKSLGFRGEALSSISACSRLTIDSNGYRIVVDNGQKGAVVPGSVAKGTSVCMEDLFENIPARKQFLKRPQSEALECRKTFIEKALGFPQTEFLLFSDGELRLHLQKADRQTRSVQIMKLDKAFMPARIMEMKCEGDNISLYAICSDPSCYRRDRTQIRVLVNNRVIDSYQFVQAITSAFSVSLPGGAFPYFHLYIEDNPSLVDFNIHPTKRECKLRNQSQIYGSITNMIRGALTESSAGAKQIETQSQQRLFSENHEMPYQSRVHIETPSVSEKPKSPYKSSAKPFDPSWFENAKTILSKREETEKPQKSRSTTEVSTTVVVPQHRYIGQLFNTFLLVETDQSILFIDQHALHERLLYDEIRAQKDIQRLIVPYQFEVDRSVDDYLCENSIVYADFGIELTRRESLLWEMASLPAYCRDDEKKIADYIRTQTGDIQSVQKGLFAIIACHAAIKAGDALDRNTAENLVQRCFMLDRMVCPHGRPFTFTFSKEELYRKVGRIV